MTPLVGTISVSMTPVVGTVSGVCNIAVWYGLCFYANSMVSVFVIAAVARPVAARCRLRAAIPIRERSLSVSQSQPASMDGSRRVGAVKATTPPTPPASKRLSSGGLLSRRIYTFPVTAAGRVAGGRRMP